MLGLHKQRIIINKVDKSINIDNLIIFVIGINDSDKLKKIMKGEPYFSCFSNNLAVFSKEDSIHKELINFNRKINKMVGI